MLNKDIDPVYTEIRNPTLSKLGVRGPSFDENLVETMSLVKTSVCNNSKHAADGWTQSSTKYRRMIWHHSMLVTLISVNHCSVKANLTDLI